jgi:hypothetical protein
MTEEIDNLLDYLQRAGLNTISINSPAWKLMHKIKKTNPLGKSTTGYNSMELGNGQKMTVGKLVEHKTVPKLGLGLVVAESRSHPNYWIVKWCDPRYHDVGQMGIHAEYLKIM